jgi:hypothetical protein
MAFEYFTDHIFNKRKMEWTRDKLIDMTAKELCLILSSMFEYKGLPDTVPKKFLELYMQNDGVVCFTLFEDKYYCFFGGHGGRPDEYYIPTQFIVANPYLRFNKTLTIGEDCEVIYNDELMIGMRDYINKYAVLLTDSLITLRQANINMRIPFLLTASDDNTLESAKLFMKKIYQGDFSIISTNAFMDSNSLNMHLPQKSGGATITQLIEYHQYLLASFYRGIGLDLSFNMKREALNSAETTMNDDVLAPKVDDMLRERRKGIDRINKHYGLNITVDLASSWKKNRIEEKAVLDNLKEDNEPDKEPDKEPKEPETKGELTKDE